MAKWKPVIYTLALLWSLNELAFVVHLHNNFFDFAPLDSKSSGVPSSTSFLKKSSSTKESFTCHIPPGKHPIEVENRDFLFFYTIGFEFRERENKGLKLLCVIPKENNVQLQTFASHCDLVVTDSTLFPDFHFVPDLRQVDFGAFDHDWFYFSRKDEYLIVPHVREKMVESEAPSTLAWATTQKRARYDFPKVVCPGINIFNRKAFLHAWKHFRDSLFVGSTVSWPELQCVRPSASTETPAHLYYDVIREEDPEHLYRIHDILYMTCEDHWKHHPKAIDTNGKSFVPDVTMLRSKHPELNFSPPGIGSICKLPPGEGVEGPKGFEAMGKIELASEHQEKRVLCMVYTHAGAHAQVQTLAETWAPLCDGYFAASNVTDLSIGAVRLTHEGEEAYGNMWMKVRSMLQFAYENYSEDFDYFHVGGDDMFLIPENLRYVAATGGILGAWNQSGPLFLGSPMADPQRRIWRYNGGGSGYTLNRHALKLLVTVLFPTPSCWPHIISSEEDRIVSRCFRSVGIIPPNTHDVNDEPTYHLADFQFHATWNRNRRAFWRPPIMIKFHNISQPEYLRQISKYSVAFHLKPVKEKYRKFWPKDMNMRRSFALLRGLCP